MTWQSLRPSCGRWSFEGSWSTAYFRDMGPSCEFLLIRKNCELVKRSQQLANLASERHIRSKSVQGLFPGGIWWSFDSKHFFALKRPSAWEKVPSGSSFQIWEIGMFSSTMQRPMEVQLCHCLGDLAVVSRGPAKAIKTLDNVILDLPDIYSWNFNNFTPQNKTESSKLSEKKQSWLVVSIC